MSLCRTSLLVALACWAVGCDESGQAGPDVGLDAVADAAGDALADAADDASGDAGDLGETDAAADGVADTPAELPQPPVYPLDDVLRVNHIQAEGTHNSTHIEPESAVPDWEYTMDPLDVQLEQHGVRQVEIDVHYNTDGTFSVFHLPLLDPESTCPDLVNCLTVVKGWSDKNPGHHLLWVFIEPKDELDANKIAGHYAELDAAIRGVWPPERLLTPDDVRAGHATVREALEADGWPTLGATRNRVMFGMLDSSEHRAGYLETYPNLEGAVIFMRDGRGQPWGAWLESGSPAEKTAALGEGYLVRGGAGRAANSQAEDEAKLAEALAYGATFISTDFPGERDDGFWMEIPGGSPSRCNPVTAPPECTAADIESLAR